MNTEPYGLQDLLYLMRRLRNPETGCPWDIRQTFASIAPHTLEEAYEVVDCIEREDYAHLREELGDLLFQVVYYGQMADEQRLFNFGDIVDGLVNKLLLRHPHVFPGGSLATEANDGAVDEEDVQKFWEDSKARERSAKASTSDSLLADVPTNFPALSRAQKLQKRAARVGFDWPDIQGVLSKLDEEAEELKQALAGGNDEQVAEEVGDLLFTCVNLARHLNIDAEAVGRHSARKFERRFRAMERAVASDGRQWQELRAEELEEYWQRVKAGRDDEVLKGGDEL